MRNDGGKGRELKVRCGRTKWITIQHTLMTARSAGRRSQEGWPLKDPHSGPGIFRAPPENGRTAACAPAAAGRSRRQLPYLVVGPERRVRGQWGRHGGGIVGARFRFRREVGCPVSSLRYVLVFARGRAPNERRRRSACSFEGHG